MRVTKRAQHLDHEPAEGDLQETVLATAERTGWELVYCTAPAGLELLPVPMPGDELGFILHGRVRMIPLPEDYDPEALDLEEAAVVLGPEDAFALDRGERVMMEVLEDLTFVYARPARNTATTPPGCCA